MQQTLCLGELVFFLCSTHHSHSFTFILLAFSGFTDRHSSLFRFTFEPVAHSQVFEEVSSSTAGGATTMGGIGFLISLLFIHIASERAIERGGGGGGSHQLAMKGEERRGRWVGD